MLIGSHQHDEFTFISLNVKLLQDSWLPGSSASFYQDDFGTIRIHQYQTDHYSIRYILMDFIKSIPLVFKEEKSFIQNWLALNGSFYLKTNKKKKVYVKEVLILKCCDSAFTVLQKISEILRI